MSKRLGIVLAALFGAVLILFLSGGSASAVNQEVGRGDQIQEAGNTPYVTEIPTIAAYRRSAQITALAIKEMMTVIRPGHWDYPVPGWIRGIFTRYGVYPEPCWVEPWMNHSHTVCTGRHLTQPQGYFDYCPDPKCSSCKCQFKPGGLIIIDTGAGYNGTCSDVTRTFPVGSTFTSRQLDLYYLILETQKKVEEYCYDSSSTGPSYLANISLLELQGLLSQHMDGLLKGWDLKAKDPSGNWQPIKVFTGDPYGHPWVHYIGFNYDVHGDHLPYHTWDKLQTGQVFSVEVGLYIASENIGIRIEDTYLTTGAGAQCLSKDCPKEIADVLRLRRQANSN